MNSRPKNHLPLGPVIFFVQRDRPSADIAAFRKMKTNVAATPTDRMSAGRLLGKFSNQSVKIVTATDRSRRLAWSSRCPNPRDRARPRAGDSRRDGDSGE